MLPGRWIIAFAAVPLCGCGVALPTPTIQAVTPASGWNGEPTSIAISGQGFYPQVVFDAGHADQADLDQDFAAWLVAADGTRTALSQVAAESYEVVDATVDAGLTPGLYGIEVSGPTGRTTSLDAAFTVSDVLADRLMFTPSSGVSFEVGKSISVFLALYDPDGLRVFQDPEVEIAITSDDGPVAPTWAAGSLADQVELSSGNELRGKLVDGAAEITFTLTSSGTIHVTAAATDTAAGISGDEQDLAVTSGNQLSAVLTLPSDPFVTTAGVTFPLQISLVDTYGNLVTDQYKDVLLDDACHSMSQLVTLHGTTTFDVTPTASTDAYDGTCAADTIIAEGVCDPLTEPDGCRTAPFEVIPAATTHFNVAAFKIGPGALHAGDTLGIDVTPLDDYGNISEWTGTLTYTDAQGVEGALDGCSQPTQVTEFYCTLIPTYAAPGQFLEVEGDDGTTGISNLYTVLPGEDPARIDEVPPALVTAGVPFEDVVALGDTWGNLMDASQFGAPLFSVTDPAGDVDCDFARFEVTGECVFSCVAHLAGTATLVADGPNGLSDTQDTRVENGALGSVDLNAAAQVIAGDGLVVTGSAFDVFGNPYVVQVDPVLQLSDTGGSWSVPSVSLDPAGTFALVGHFTKAGITRLSVSQDGVTLGTTSDIDVLAGPVVGLAVEPVEPWAWVGSPVEVLVEAVDSYGNVASWDGTATVTSRLGAAAPVLANVVAGVGSSPITWTTAVLSDILDADASGGLSGSSRPIHAAIDCATDPTPALAFNGSPVGRACFDPVAELATLPGSFAGSVSTGPPFSGFALAADDLVTTGSSQSLSVDVHATGRYDILGLVVQSDGCGAEIATTAWVGPDDLQPVGPLELTADLGALDIGVGTTLVHVTGALDCNAAIAAGGTVYVRTDRGEITGATPTGVGLSMVLDAAGDGDVTLDATGVDSGGTAGVGAWVASGAAAGQVFVDFVGDDRHPTVWSQTPSGDATGTIDEVRVTFSEPLRPESLTPGSALLDGPLGPETVVLTLEDDDSTLVITPSAPVDGSLGAYAVTVTTDIRDPAGNRIDGASIGAASEWDGVFGAVGAVVDPVACVPQGTVFRPDGDDGAGVEADSVSIDVSSATAPTWWVLSVAPALDPAPVRVDRIVPVGPDETLTWDGRDAGGRVVDDGTWQLTITPLDSAGNSGAGCVVPIAVDNHEVNP